MIQVRPARSSDAKEIVDLQNGFIRNTTVTFTTTEKSPEDVANQLPNQSKDSTACLVAEMEACFAGFANLGTFRAGPGYRFTQEISIYVGDTCRGVGVGQRLLAACESHARQQGIRTLVAGISGENGKALKFFEKQGFSHTARMPEVGHKFDRFLDLVLMQKFL